MAKSEELYRKAVNLMPAGVSSPVRAIKPYPFYTERAEGCRIYDVDGNEYIDYCLAYGPMILGHTHPEVKQAIVEQAEKGWLYGTPIELEVKFAELITSLYPSIEMLRFVNTGSEATMAAIRLARGYTGRNGIVKVEGSFHGAHDAVLVKAGSGATTHGTPNSAGVPPEFVKHTYQVPYNDIESLSSLLEKKREEIAAMILEPVMGNSSLILPEKDYLKEVRKVTQENDVLLIFDEVITGFRLSEGGAQQYYGVRPDLTTLGKIAGGGLPVGVYGGRKEIMEMISPLGPVYQAGTFSGNPLTMVAGYTTVSYLVKNKPYRQLEERTRAIVEGIQPELEKRGYSAGCIASMFCIYFGEKPGNYSEALKLDAAKFLEFFAEMLRNGIFLPPSQYETCFVSVAHGEEEVEKTVEVANACLRKL